MPEPQLLPLLASDAGCSLPSGELDARMDAWRVALADSEVLTAGRGRVVFELGTTTDLPALAHLCELEVGCCTFFTFAVEVAAGSRRLVVSTPPDQGDVLDRFTALLSPP